MTLQAFHNDQKIKDKYINRVIAHAKADNLVKGATGSEGKGCAVACTLDMVYDHARYPVELGIPEWLARLEDALFEGMPNDEAMIWPQRFLEAISVGADLEKAKKPFLIYLMEENLKSIRSVVYDKEKFPDVRLAIYKTEESLQMMIEAHRSGDEKDLSAAASAAESAVWSAAESAARSAAASAARSAVWSAVWSAASAARSAAFLRHSEKLLEILQGIGA